MAQTSVGKWKKAAIQGLPKVFAGNDTISANQRQIRAMQAKIGELVIEKDFLDNAFVDKHRRLKWVKQGPSKLALRRQLELLALSKSTYY